MKQLQTHYISAKFIIFITYILKYLALLMLKARFNLIPEETEPNEDFTCCSPVSLLLSEAGRYLPPKDVLSISLLLKLLRRDDWLCNFIFLIFALLHDLWIFKLCLTFGLF